MVPSCSGLTHSPLKRTSPNPLRVLCSRDSGHLPDQIDAAGVLEGWGPQPNNDDQPQDREHLLDPDLWHRQPPHVRDPPGEMSAIEWWPLQQPSERRIALPSLDRSEGKLYTSGEVSLAIALDGRPFEIELIGTGSMMTAWGGTGRLMSGTLKPTFSCVQGGAWAGCAGNGGMHEGPWD